MQVHKSGGWISSDRKVIFWIFLLFTGISSLQFLQYFIAYNNSYPFPWRWNLGLTFGTFYSYFPFVLLIFEACRKLKSRQPRIAAWLMWHLFLAVGIGLAHLALVNLTEWVQVKNFAEHGFMQSYRWKLAGYLHLELLMYAFISGIWYVVQLLRWRKASKGEITGELEKDRPKISRLKVKNGLETSYVNVSEIRWFEAYDNYVKCHLPNRYVLVRATLTGLEKDLDPKRFQRIHRSCLVALPEVSHIRSREGKYEVLLQDDTSLRLSKTYKSQLEKRLEQLISS